MAKQLPKLWPRLLDAKNREIVMEYAKGIADRSAQRRPAAKIDLTVALSESMAERATTNEEQEQARRWQRRAAAMRDRLALPVMSDKRAHRAALAADLQSLHEEMSAVLREDEPPQVIDFGQEPAERRSGAGRFMLMVLPYWRLTLGGRRIDFVFEVGAENLPQAGRPDLDGVPVVVAWVAGQPWRSRRW